MAMNFLPHTTLTFHSPLGENEIRNRLNCLTRAGNAFRTTYYPDIKISEYSGTLRWNDFELTRAIFYRNSFLPQITGTISPEGNRTRLDVRMRLNIFVMVFGSIWFGGVFLAVLAVLFTGGAVNPGALAVPVFMLVFGYALFTIPFRLEAEKSTKDLSRLFGCEPEKRKATRH